ncbi:MAG: hypothetical protein HC812_01535 [Leptolyngbya sp. RL_3_1]|nr:hypothetical protein [Leptolyngbya sp. RL_3_1]
MERSPRFLNRRFSPQSGSVYRKFRPANLDYPVNQRQTVTYAGPPLRPGQVYTLRAQHQDFPDSIYESRQMELLSLERQVEIAWALVGLDGSDGSAVDQALARADYFWGEGLEADAWREVVQSESALAAEAIAPPPTGSASPQSRANPRPAPGKGARLCALLQSPPLNKLNKSV